MRHRTFNNRCLSILWIAVILITNVAITIAGTPHTVYGSVTYNGGGSPSSVTFSAYITARPGNVLTESSIGCDYSSGQYYVQVGNFSSWTADEVMHIDLSDGLGGSASGNVTLTYDSSGTDILNLTIYTPDIDVNPGSKDYGDVEITDGSTETFVVSNTGGATLSVSSTTLTGGDAGEFTITGGGGIFTLGAGATHNVDVRFNPSATGAKSTTLRFVSNDPGESTKDISLSGNGVTIPDISASPNPANYGSVVVGSYSDNTVTVSNQGTGTLNVSSTTIGGTHSAQFNIQSGGGSFSLAPAATRNITVRFSPASAGSKNASLQIGSDDPDEDPYYVTLNGTGVVPDIIVNPGSGNYGSVEVGSSSTETFIVSNTGGATLSVSSTSLTGGDAVEFTITGGGGSFTLTAGATRNVDVQFSPSSTGVKSTTLRFASNDPDEDPKDVALSGTGIVIPDIAVTPGTKNYGDVLIGSSSPQIFTVTNEGTGDLSVTSSSLTGTHSGEYSITSGGGSFIITPGSSHDIEVSFNPVSAGSKNAVLRIQSDDPDENPVDISLTGNGVEVPVPDIDVDPESFNYGDVPVDTGITKTFVVTNYGIAELSVTLVSLTGDNSDEFSIISGGGSFTLASGATRDITVGFSPTSAGSKSAALHFESDDPDENPYDVELSGNGIVIPDIAISPSSKDYGDVLLGSSAVQTFVVKSEGTGTLTVSSVNITGTDASEFAITSGGGSFSLSSGANRDIIVSFDPSSSGAKSATLRLTSDDPDEDPLDVSLAGNGLDVPVPDINILPSSYDYGDVAVDSSETETFIISNEGTADLSVTSVIIEGEHPGDFSIVSGETTFVLTPGSTENIEIQFMPGTVGVRNATLVVTSDDPDESILSVSLTGAAFINYIESPYLVNCYPPAGALSIPVNSAIQFKIKDDIDGVDISTVNVYVNEDAIISGGVDQTGGNVNIKSHGPDYTICYNPDSDPAEDTMIIVHVQCNDLAPYVNSLDSTYSFHTADWNTLNLTSVTIGPEGGVVYEDFTGIQIEIPESALEDSTVITIGLANDLPELPKSVIGIGLNYYFGPDGLTFNDSIIIGIPYSPDDLINAGVTSPMDLPVFYYSTSAGSWMQLEVFDYDDDYIYTKVIEFCYLTVCRINTTITDIKEIYAETQLNHEYVLYQNYPNPVSIITTISFSIAKASFIRLIVYDINLGEIEVLMDKECLAGKYDIIWNAEVYPCGIYFYRLQTDEFTETRKMIIQ